MEFFAKTDKGLKRPLNEDAYGTFPEHGLFLACDGMGGHAAGDYASRKVVETVAAIHKKSSRELYRKVKSEYNNIPEKGSRLAVQVMLANRRLFRLAVMYPKLRGMGTTLTAVIFDRGFANIVNVGDSRTYLFRDSKLNQLSVDHSWVEEMLQDGEIKEQEKDSFGAKNVITRALGTNPAVKIDYRAQKTKKDDIFLMCSDGLCGEVNDREIENVIRQAGGNLKKIAGRLIEAAKEAGGSDNITVVLAKTTRDEPLTEEIEPEKIISVGTEKPILDELDKHIDEYFSPEETKVPKGVEKDKKKFYQNPLVTTALLFILFFGGAVLYTCTRYRHIVESSGEISVSRGDILIRTSPSGASVSIQGEDGYSEERKSPTDFLGLEEGRYELLIEKEDYEIKTLSIYLREGIQESRNIELTPEKQIILTLGTNVGFDSSRQVYINDETVMHYGRPLTVGRIGFSGKRISISSDRIHTIKIGDQVKEISPRDLNQEVEIVVEGKELLVKE